MPNQKANVFIVPNIHGGHGHICSRNKNEGGCALPGVSVNLPRSTIAEMRWDGYSEASEGHDRQSDPIEYLNMNR